METNSIYNNKYKETFQTEANSAEDEKNIDEAVIETEKKRPGCVTAWLWVFLILNLINTIEVTINDWITSYGVAYILDFILMSISVILLYKWKGVGLFLYLVSFLIYVLLNLSYAEFAGNKHVAPYFAFPLLLFCVGVFGTKMANGKTYAENLLPRRKQKQNDVRYTIDQESNPIPSIDFLGDYVKGYTSANEPTPKAPIIGKLFGLLLGAVILFALIYYVSWKWVAVLPIYAIAYYYDFRKLFKHHDLFIYTNGFVWREISLRGTIFKEHVINYDGVMGIASPNAIYTNLLGIYQGTEIKLMVKNLNGKICFSKKGRHLNKEEKPGLYNFWGIAFNAILDNWDHISMRKLQHEYTETGYRTFTSGDDIVKIGENEVEVKSFLRRIVLQYPFRYVIKDDILILPTSSDSKEDLTKTKKSYRIDLNLMYNRSCFMSAFDALIHKESEIYQPAYDENEEFSVDQFIIYLTIKGSIKEEIPIEVTDLNKTIREQIDSIIQVFKLPKMDGGGNPITYQLGRVISDEEPIILQPEDEKGRDMSLMDYNIKSGDHLCLYAVPYL